MYLHKESGSNGADTKTEPENIHDTIKLIFEKGEKRMDVGNPKSILQMARGAIMERADYEVSRLLQNIFDPNTSATAARKVTLTLTLKPDDTRQNISLSCSAKSTLAATNPVTTMLYASDEETVTELLPQIPGQFSMDGQEQEVPATLRVIKFA